MTPKLVMDGQPLVNCPSCDQDLTHPRSVHLVLEIDGWTSMALSQLVDGQPVDTPSSGLPTTCRLDEVRCRCCGVLLDKYA